MASLVGGAPLGGGWLGLLALCVLAGAVLAAALRAAPAVARALRPSAPRLGAAAHSWWRSPAALAAGTGRGPAPRPLGRAPPACI